MDEDEKWSACECFHCGFGVDGGRDIPLLPAVGDEVEQLCRGGKGLCWESIGYLWDAGFGSRFLHTGGGSGSLNAEWFEGVLFD